tara:strand:- start:4171 stop:4899 length:729 start_codon:yes stop_codon:yes gene_type:complete
MNNKLTLFTTHKFSLDKCPPNLKNNLNKWKNLNSEFQFKYFDDDELNNWMKNNVSNETFELFLSLNSGAGKADLFRVSFLYYHGGIWIDADLPAFDILKQKADFISSLKENQAFLIRNRRCDNPRYTFIASYYKNNKLFGELLNLINKHIIFAKKSKKTFTTIHITGPFVLHKLINIKYNLKNINQLELNKKYNFDNSYFIYINDIVPPKNTYDEENVYKGYRKDLEYMNVKTHSIVNSIKN